MEDATIRDRKEFERLTAREQGAAALRQQWSEPARPEAAWRLGPQTRYFAQKHELAGRDVTKYTVGSGSARANSLQAVRDICERQAQEGLR